MTRKAGGTQSLLLLPGLAFLALARPTVALARDTVQAIYVELPGAAGDDAAWVQCRDQVLAVGWAPIHRVDFATPPKVRAPEALQAALAAMGALQFQDALQELDAAAAEASASGAAGLSNSQLGDIFLYRAIARLRLDASAGGRAWEDFVRAATLNPERVLDPGRVPPAGVEAWNRAVLAVGRRPRGQLTVRAPVTATILIDARPPVRSPALLAGLPYGEHLVRVEEPSHWPWATVIPLTAPALEVDVPARPQVALDDAAAASIAGRNGAAFAVVMQLLPTSAGASATVSATNSPTTRSTTMLDLHLVETATSLRRAGVVVALSEPGALPVALARFQRHVRGATENLVPDAVHGVAANPVALNLLATSGGPPATLWHGLRRSTWGIIAAGVVVGLAAGIVAVVGSRNDPTASGFTVTADTTRLGQ